METVGRKSKSAVASAFVGGLVTTIAGAVFLVFLLGFFAQLAPASFKSFIYLMSIIPMLFVVFGLKKFFLGFKLKRLPADLIIVDGSTVRLAAPEKTILIADISAVTAHNNTVRHHNNVGGFSYTTTQTMRYGTITILTKNNERFSQQCVDNVQEVAQVLNNLVAKSAR